MLCLRLRLSFRYAIASDITVINPTMRIAIVGAGISGIAAASILNKAGHTTVLFEKSADIGGVWAVGYPEVGLQNIFYQYALSQFPWPFTPHHHPTASEIMRYLHMAVEHLRPGAALYWI